MPLVDAKNIPIYQFLRETKGPNKTHFLRDVSPMETLTPNINWISTVKRVFFSVQRDSKIWWFRWYIVSWGLLSSNCVGWTSSFSITMTSFWARWLLKSPASRLFTQPFIKAKIKENIKAPRHWPLCGEFTGDRWITRTNGQLRGKCFHLMTSSRDGAQSVVVCCHQIAVIVWTCSFSIKVSRWLNDG